MSEFSLVPATLPAAMCERSFSDELPVVPANLRCMGVSAVRMRESIRCEAKRTNEMLAKSRQNAAFRNTR